MNNDDQPPVSPDELAALNLQERTDAKLRYAKVHPTELKAVERLSEDDFERSHQEAFLYHLFGARGALLSEINLYYAAGEPECTSMGKIRDALAKRGVKSLELQRLYRLECDKNNWYSKAKDMRDRSTHTQGVRRTAMVGGDRNGQVNLHDTKTGALSDHHYLDDFENWLEGMGSLVTELRASALQTCA